MDVLFEDESLIIAVKPPGIPTQPDKTGDLDMLTLAGAHTNAPVYAVHRLDRPVGGLIIIAKKKEACARLSADFASLNVSKQYLAVVCGNAPEQGELRHFLLKNQRLNRSAAVNKHVKGAKEAALTFTCIADLDSNYGTLCLLNVSPQTGRHHQIRVQFATAGLPLWGDTKYNTAFAKPGAFVNLALWANRLCFSHPKSGKAMDFAAYPAADTYPFSLFGNFIRTAAHL